MAAVSASKARILFFESASRFSLLLEHDLFRKPVSTFRDHALVSAAAPRRPWPRPRRNGTLCAAPVAIFSPRLIGTQPYYRCLPCAIGAHLGRSCGFPEVAAKAALLNAAVRPRHRMTISGNARARAPRPALRARD